MKNEELQLYKSKVKKYHTEIQDLKEELDKLNSKYIKVCNERDKYKQKILDAKEDISKFSLLVDERAKQKSADAFQEIAELKKDLRRKDDEIHHKSQQNKQFK